MYNNQLTNSTNKIKTTWNIIKAEMNRLKDPQIQTLAILKIPQRIITDIFYLYLKVLLMVLEAKTIKAPILLKTQPIIYQTYFIPPFPV